MANRSTNDKAKKRKPITLLPARCVEMTDAKHKEAVRAVAVLIGVAREGLHDRRQTHSRLRTSGLVNARVHRTRKDESKAVSLATTRPAPHVGLD